LLLPAVPSENVDGRLSVNREGCDYPPERNNQIKTQEDGENPVDGLRFHSTPFGYSNNKLCAKIYVIVIIVNFALQQQAVVKKIKLDVK
jgi:hypothetical protein